MMTRVKAGVVSLIKAHLWKLPIEFLEKALARAVLLRVHAKVFASPRIAKREAVWDHVIATIGADTRLLFLEFGVFEGYSIRYFADRMHSADSRFFGFDSFEGLPETWGRKQAGHFSTGGNLPQIADPRVGFVKGWFQRTLPGFSFDGAAQDAVLVHLDADLYSSTLFVLASIWTRLDSFYALFDEFNGHEARALYNFCQAFPCTVEFLAHDGELPQRVFCRISKSP